ncbi:hypothetical protein PPERSA_02639 [Pseudocohnilembus persalinus]|uniref:GAIN-B domain-containing protein n=1 Tax=Pseudocohnilembus persalinus TaxID=266149 RepID=A0A0V0R5L9_PSEPJ|nr:hypothetical protein PPERSA_02639 [Pseudocohnilembus persalinus]|eukprot:KRX09767.1 hypothetical protein PPERSA_02639 [Pseudocohnilembus persalinus]
MESYDQWSFVRQKQIYQRPCISDQEMNAGQDNTLKLNDGKFLSAFRTYSWSQVYYIQFYIFQYNGSTQGYKKKQADSFGGIDFTLTDANEEFAYILSYYDLGYLDFGYYDFYLNESPKGSRQIYISDPTNLIYNPQIKQGGNLLYITFSLYDTILDLYTIELKIIDSQQDALNFIIENTLQLNSNNFILKASQFYTLQAYNDKTALILALDIETQTYYKYLTSTQGIIQPPISENYNQFTISPYDYDQSRNHRIKSVKLLNTQLSTSIFIKNYKTITIMTYNQQGEFICIQDHQYANNQYNFFNSNYGLINNDYIWVQVGKFSSANEEAVILLYNPKSCQFYNSEWSGALSNGYQLQFFSQTYAQFGDSNAIFLNTLFENDSYGNCIIEIIQTKITPNSQTLEMCGPFEIENFNCDCIGDIQQSYSRLKSNDCQCPTNYYSQYPIDDNCQSVIDDSGDDGEEEEEEEDNDIDDDIDSDGEYISPQCFYIDYQIQQIDIELVKLSLDGLVVLPDYTESLQKFNNELCQFIFEQQQLIKFGNSPSCYFQQNSALQKTYIFIQFNDYTVTYDSADTVTLKSEIFAYNNCGITNYIKDYINIDVLTTQEEQFKSTQILINQSQVFKQQDNIDIQIFKIINDGYKDLNYISWQIINVNPSISQQNLDDLNTELLDNYQNKKYFHLDQGSLQQDKIYTFNINYTNYLNQQGYYKDPNIQDKNLQQEDFTLSWKCIDTSTQASCKDKNQNDVIGSQKNNGSLFYSANDFEPFSIFQFFFTAEKYGVTKTHNVVYTFIQDELPELNVTVPDEHLCNSINKNDFLYLQTNYESNDSNDVIYQLLLVYNDEKVAIKNFDYKNFKFRIWDLFNNFENQNYEILAKVIVYDTQYSFYQSFSYIIDINQPPVNGTISIYPSFGISIETQFTISALNFVEKLSANNLLNQYDPLLSFNKTQQLKSTSLGLLQMDNLINTLIQQQDYDSYKEIIQIINDISKIYNYFMLPNQDQTDFQGQQIRLNQKQQTASILKLDNNLIDYRNNNLDQNSSQIYNIQETKYQQNYIISENYPYPQQQNEVQNYRIHIQQDPDQILNLNNQTTYNFNNHESTDVTVCASSDDGNFWSTDQCQTVNNSDGTTKCLCDSTGFITVFEDFEKIFSDSVENIGKTFTKDSIKQGYKRDKIDKNNLQIKNSFQQQNLIDQDDKANLASVQNKHLKEKNCEKAKLSHQIFQENNWETQDLESTNSIINVQKNEKFSSVQKLRKKQTKSLSNYHFRQNALKKQLKNLADKKNKFNLSNNDNNQNKESDKCNFSFTISTQENPKVNNFLNETQNRFPNMLNYTSKNTVDDLALEISSVKDISNNRDNSQFNFKKSYQNDIDTSSTQNLENDKFNFKNQQSKNNPSDNSSEQDEPVSYQKNKQNTSSISDINSRQNEQENQNNQEQYSIIDLQSDTLREKQKSVQERLDIQSTFQNNINLCQ